MPEPRSQVTPTFLTNKTRMCFVAIFELPYPLLKQRERLTKLRKLKKIGLRKLMTLTRLRNFEDLARCVVAQDFNSSTDRQFRAWWIS